MAVRRLFFYSDCGSVEDRERDAWDDWCDSGI